MPDENRRVKVSATVITFNEEQDIEECLKSILWADEIVVVDSLSIDRTVDITKQYTDKVYENPFPGFAAQKNFAAEKASGDWILQLDADERIPPSLRDEILSTVAKPDACDLYYIPRRNYWLGHWIRHGGWYPDFAARLFRRGKGRWVGFTHEKFVIDGTSGMLKEDLFHDNLKSVHEHVQKQLISTIQEVREAAQNDLRLVWFIPPSIIIRMLKGFAKGPINWLTIRLLYKDMIKNKIEIIWLMPFYPVLKFLYMYILRLGFLDGAPGFWVAALSAVYTTIRYAKLWEYAHGGKHRVIPSDEEMRTYYRSWWPSG
jgi:glycosyltransferase involved in cell wall biosynthesis